MKERAEMVGDPYRHLIKNDVAYRYQQFSTPASPVSISSLVYLVVASEQSYLDEMTSIVMKETGATDVICASIEEMLAFDIIRRSIYQREASEGLHSLYVINNVGFIQDNATQFLASMNFLHTATDSLGAAQDATFILLWWDIHSHFSSLSLEPSSSSVAWRNHLRQLWSTEDPAINVDALIGRITRVITQPTTTLSTLQSVRVSEAPIFICPSPSNTFMALGDLLEDSNFTPFNVVVTTIIFLILMINVNRDRQKAEVVNENRSYVNDTDVKKHHDESVAQNKLRVSEDANRNRRVHTPVTVKSKFRKKKKNSDEIGNRQSATPVATTRSRSMLQRRRQKKQK